MTTALEDAPVGAARLVSTALLLAVTTIVLVSGVMTASSLELYGFDFRYQYYGGASAVAEGDPLYHPAADAPIEDAKAYVYPPLTAVALVPVTFLPVDVAVVLAVLASVAAVLLSLALVGVRDVRCYLAVVASAPAWNVIETANLTALLALGLALAWRLRATVGPLAIVLGLAIAAKLLVWPLLVWAATRRLRAAALGFAISVVAVLVSWALIGFQGMTGYPELLRALADVHAEQSYSIVGMAAAAGLEEWVGHAVTLGAGGGLLAYCIVLGRRGDETRAFMSAVAAALALTPIMWQHYLVLLLVPLAITRPRFSWIWLLPLAAWVSPRTGHGAGIEPFVPGLVAGLLVAVVLVHQRAGRDVAEAR